MIKIYLQIFEKEKKNIFMLLKVKKNIYFKILGKSGMADRPKGFVILYYNTEYKIIKNK